MRGIFIVTCIAALAWMTWWVVGSSALERALAGWIDERRAEGWVAEYADIGVRGFPNRFDTRVTELRLADPDTGVAWTAPFFEILQLSYTPNRAVLVWPNTHTFSTPFETIEIVSEQSRGSVGFRPVPSLELDRATIVLDEVGLASNLGWTVSLDDGRFSIRAEDGENTYRVGAELLDLRPSGGVKDTLDPAGLLPAVVERLHLDATLALTDPLDRFAIEDARPQITGLDLTNLSAAWGEVTFRAAGELQIDGAGVPEGEITVRAVEWRRLLDMAVSTGLLPETFLPAIDSTLELMAGLSGDTETLDAPLTFDNGFVSFGPIPLGRAPRIVIR